MIGRRWPMSPLKSSQRLNYVLIASLSECRPLCLSCIRRHFADYAVVRLSPFACYLFASIIASFWLLAALYLSDVARCTHLIGMSLASIQSQKQRHVQLITILTTWVIGKNVISTEILLQLFHFCRVKTRWLLWPAYQSLTTDITLKVIQSPVFHHTCWYPDLNSIILWVGAIKVDLFYYVNIYLLSVNFSCQINLLPCYNNNNNVRIMRRPRC